MINEFLNNNILWSAVISTIIAQVTKLIWYRIFNQNWEWQCLLHAGGMPSSHAAATTSLATSVGLTEGMNTSIFATTVVFAGIVMYDAAGIRRQAGIHAKVINELLRQFISVFEEIRKQARGRTINLEKLKLREILGHQPVEVLGGFLLGMFTSFILYWTLNTNAQIRLFQYY